MSQVTYLAGKVSKQSLPVLQAPAGGEAPRLKRLLLPQGELAQFYDADEPIRYMAWVEIRPGCARGNHYHKVKKEFLFVIQGELCLVVQDVRTRRARLGAIARGRRSRHRNRRRSRYAGLRSRAAHRVLTRPFRPGRHLPLPGIGGLMD